MHWDDRYTLLFSGLQWFLVSCMEYVEDPMIKSSLSYRRTDENLQNIAFVSVGIMTNSYLKKYIYINAFLLFYLPKLMRSITKVKAF